MKKILSILGGLTMAYSPIMVSSHLISSYINTNKSNPVENSINEIENTIKNSSDIKEIYNCLFQST